MSYITEASREKGRQAEADFKNWLNGQKMAHMVVDQSHVSVPPAWKGKIKRPDVLVGVPGTGLVAIDVKRKEPIKGRFTLDVDEIEKLRRFAFLFHLTPLFVNLITPEKGIWYRPEQFISEPQIVMREQPTQGVLVACGCQFSTNENFYTVLGRALQHFSEIQ